MNNGLGIGLFNKQHFSPVRIPGFGNTTTVEYLDPSQLSVGIYFANVAQRLVQGLGYQRGHNLHGAPYDFRKAANEQAEFFAKFEKLIEETYERSGGRRVILLCHSMGSPMTLYFLNQRPRAWKDKYVRAMITLAGVWGGTVRAMKVFAVGECGKCGAFCRFPVAGDNLGAWIVSQNSLMVEQRSNPSLAWLMPSDKLWKADEVLLQVRKHQRINNPLNILFQSPELNATVKDFESFYSMLGHAEAYQMRLDVQHLVRDLKAPEVDVHCAHGSGVATTEK